jgi:hypothetical protein
MAVCAVGRIGIFLEMSLSMTTLKIVFCNLGMTIGAIDPACSFARTVSLWIDIRMALHAGDASVCGILDVCFFYCEGNLLAFDCFNDIVFFVTLQTFTV